MEPTHRPLVFATVLELDIVGLLGTGHGVDARGALEVAKEELEPFEVTKVLNDPKAWAVYVSRRLMSASCAA